MSNKFRAAMAFVRFWEGGWSNDRLDPGGLTKWGVTIRTVIAKALDFNGDGKVNEKDLAAMTEAQAEALYRSDYFDALRCEDLPAPLAMLVFDCAVNQGPGRAARFLQETVGAVADGVIGDKTVAAAARAFAANERDVLREFQVRRALHYSSLSTFVRFGRGWFRRLIDGTIEAARIGGAFGDFGGLDAPAPEPAGDVPSEAMIFLADVAANAEAAAGTAARIAAALEALVDQARDVAGIAEDVAADLRDRADLAGEGVA